MAPLYLTFDDGPDPERTPAVLAALAAHDATATFFVLGAAVRRHPATLEAILAAGHRVELHGDAHLDHRDLGREELAVETDRALASLEALGVRPQWWRLPWGRPGPATEEVARIVGLRIVGWDLDTHDWRGDWWSDQSDGWLEAARLGGTVLLHDGIGPGATRSSIDNTLTLIEGLAGVAAAGGLALCALPAVDDPRAGSITALAGSVVPAAASIAQSAG